MDPKTIQALLEAADSLSTGRPEIPDANIRRQPLTNYSRVPVRRDGNHFFRAASYSFLHTEAYHMFFREAAVARMREFPDEYNNGYTAEEFEEYLLRCAKFGETANSNLHLACAEVIKMKINMMKVAGATLEVHKEIIPRSGKCHFEIYMFHPPAYAIHENADHRMYSILGPEAADQLWPLMSRYTEYEDDSGDEADYDS